MALRRAIGADENAFPRDVMELQAYFEPVQPGQVIRAVPGAGLRVPIWLLGSSLFSAQLAAALGLPFAFASHFAPDYLLQALDVYRRTFRPSAALAAPYAMVGVSVFAADTDAEGRRLLTSAQLQFVNLRRGTPGPLQPPVDSLEGYWSPAEKAGVERALSYAAVGSADTVARRLSAIIESTRADELMITGQIYDHAARLRSFEIAATLREAASAGIRN
jgi:luciferase family oxidoreductase group 1